MVSSGYRDSNEAQFTHFTLIESVDNSKDRCGQCASFNSGICAETGYMNWKMICKQVLRRLLTHYGQEKYAHTAYQTLMVQSANYGHRQCAFNIGSKHSALH